LEEPSIDRQTKRDIILLHRFWVGHTGQVMMLLHESLKTLLFKRTDDFDDSIYKVQHCLPQIEMSFG